MKKSLKITLGVFSIVGVLAGIFYATKENPRVYLSDRVNVAYINEDINHKDFSNVINLLNKADFNVDSKIQKGLDNIKGFYIISDSSFISDKKSCVGIIDFGYIYPIVAMKVENYFDKVNDFYVLKEEYRKKYSNNEKVYLKIEKGNFLIGKKEKDIENVLKSEKYFNQNILKILDREKNNNLGMLVLNLAKNPLGGFNEFVLTGDVSKEEDVTLTANIGGKNDIIKSFNDISKDGLSGERTIEKNKLYLRSTRDAELRSFLFFLNYFFRNSFIENLASKVYINEPKDDSKLVHLPKNELFKTNIDEAQFVAGYVDIKVKDKVIGSTELKGLAENGRLKISTNIDEKTAVNLLKAIK